MEGKRARGVVGSIKATFNLTHFYVYINYVGALVMVCTNERLNK